MKCWLALASITGPFAPVLTIVPFTGSPTLLHATINTTSIFTAREVVTESAIQVFFRPALICTCPLVREACIIFEDVAVKLGSTSKQMSDLLTSS